MAVITRLPLITFLALLRTSATQLIPDNLNRPIPKIAVVGGGIGGTSAAYFLQELFGDEALIDLYEPGHVGGRLATLPLGSWTYEAGGSILHNSNKYMKDFAAKFDLPHTSECSGRMGLFNGEKYLFKESPWSLVNYAKLLYRYGWDLVNLRQLQGKLLDRFISIYNIQEEGRAFKDVASLLSAMDETFLTMTKTSTAKWLTSVGFKRPFIDELVMAALLCNYGQTVDISAFVGMVSIMATDNDLWSVQGGNKRVAEELLRHSRAATLRRRVTHVAPKSHGQFTVVSDVAGAQDKVLMNEAKDGIQDAVPVEPRSQDYDMVVLATPLTSDKTHIKLENFTEEFTFPGRYESIFATYVQGTMRPESLKLTPDDALDEILVVNPNLVYNSFGRVHPVDPSATCPNDAPVWKLFSPKPLKESQLNEFFEHRTSTRVAAWLAYPHYSASQTLGHFELTPGLYHINAIEWAASAMEMSIIGARNVALLAFKHWRQDPEAGRKSLPREEL